MSKEVPTKEPKQLQPILAVSLYAALRYVLAICPKPKDSGVLSFVAIIPDPGKHRFLVTARNGSVWAGAWVAGDSMHRIALTHAAAKHALGRLAAEIRLAKDGDVPRVVPDDLSRKTWYVVTEGAPEPVVVHLNEFYPRWNVNSRTAPPLFPTGWEAPEVRVRDAFTASPSAFPSDVFQLGRFWPHTQTRWWIDSLSEKCRIEFTNFSEELLAFAVVSPWGSSKETEPSDPRQAEIPGTKRQDTPTAPGPDASSAGDSVDAVESDAATEPAAAEGDVAAADAAAPDAEIVDAPIPSELSPALLAAIRLAHAFRIATERQELAAWTGKNRDDADSSFQSASTKFWSAFEGLDENDRVLCTQIAGDAEKLAEVLKAHPEKGAKKKARKGDDGQQSISGSEG